MEPELIGGRYRVLRAVGQGGMGTVWLCRDEVLGREVAVKGVGLLPGHSSTDTARALREARSTAALNHPHVVTVYDVVQESDRAWLVMEHVPSRTLAAVIREEGALAPARAAAIGAQVADALAAAHAAGVTHRDVKPSNVLVTDDDLAKVGDFGLSRIVGDPTVTQSGLLTGTPGYFSPELATGADASARSDAWALGATLYAAVEGRPLYPPRDNPVAVLHDITQERPPRPERAGALEPVLTRLLDRDPVTRWSAEDARDALRRIARDDTDRTRSWHAAPVGSAPAGSAAVGPIGTSADEDRPPPGVPPAPGRPTDHPTDPAHDPAGPARPRRRRPGPVVVGVVALVAALVAAVVLLGLPEDGDPGAAPAGAGAGEGGSTGPSRQPDEDAGPDEGESDGGGDGEAQPAPEETPDDTATAEPPGDAPDRPAGGGAPAAVGFVDGYFDTVPTDLETGWASLSPGYQAETGRSSYDGFWADVADVDASDLTAVRGGRAVDVTVRYSYNDGRDVEERQRVYLRRGPSGEPLIDGYDLL